jgi:hypothetical protein
MVELMTGKKVETARTPEAKEINPYPRYGDYDITRYQSAHAQGGTIMAPSRKTG